MQSGLGLASCAFQTQYRTGGANPVEGFYAPCLSRATLYDRAVGYFRSSIYLIVGEATIDFARNGGKIRLVCSPSMTKEDIDVIDAGYRAKERVLDHLIDEIEDLIGSETTNYRARVLATLVASGALDIRIALRPEASGLYHEKIGLFKDGLGNTVSFLGSANETWNGWHERGNHEAIEVFCSWSTAVDAERVRTHSTYFDDLWNGIVPGLEVVRFPDAAKARLLSVSLGGLDDISPDHFGQSTNKKRLPLPHQIAALESWRQRGCRGVFEHATGSGKTFLAITAIKDHVLLGAPALVVVPSSLLLEQWAQEIRDEIPNAALLLAGAGHTRWAQPGRLRSMSAPASDSPPRVIVATMQTAATEKFQKSIAGGDHLLVVADEVHQAGSEFISNLLRVQAGPRIGLSATPSRYGDQIGTQKIFDFFGQVIPPPITLSDAIHAGRLVEYEYYPHAVRLTAEEADEWVALTRRIGLEIAKSSRDEGVLTERAKMLLIQRSRIAKKASAKVSLAAEVVSSCYELGQRWLVYCEDSRQLVDVIDALRNAGIRPIEYHTSMKGDPAATLDWFRSAGGVLVSIKCLDEGVDIPAADHALILASSQNPRQFIQRRGRVLRKAPDKYKAVIHDAIVVPLSVEDEPEQVALAKSELLRAIEFAKSAINRSADAELRKIALQMGLDPDKPLETGLEEDDDR